LRAYNLFRRASVGGVSIGLVAGVVLAPALGHAAEASALAAPKAIAVFHIEPGPLDAALLAYAAQAHRQLLYDTGLVAGLRSPGLRGRYGDDEALSKLLAGSGVVFDHGRADVVVLKRPASPPPQPGPISDGSLAPGQDPAGGAATTLADIVVTGSHIHGARPIAPVDTLTREDIDVSGYSQTGDLVRSLPENFAGGQNPGVMNTGGGGSVNLTNASTVNLRGLGPDATLTLLDGQRLAADGLAQAPDVSVIPLAAIDHVEVVTDGASALYGSDAVAGVVNFVLRKDYDGGEASATVGGATQGGGFETDYNALGGKLWSGGHALLSAEYLHQDDIFVGQRANTAGAPADNTLLGGQNRLSLFGDAGQALTPWVSAHIDALYSQRQAGQQAQLNAKATGFRYDLQSDVFSVNPGLDFKLPAGWSAALDGSVSRSADDLSYLSSAAVRADTDYRNTIGSVEASANGTLAHLPSGPIKLALGAGYRHEGFDTNSTVAAAARDVAYVYGEALVPLVAPSKTRLGLNALDLSLAGRFEHYSDFGSTSNPKVALRYVPVDGLTLRGTWGTSFKAPTFYQLYTQHNLEYFPAALLGGAPGGYALINFGGNPDLKPERASSWTAGFDWSPPQDRALVVSATYFDIDYTGRIASPISSPRTALSNPIFAPFIVRNPSAAQQAAALASTPIFENFAGVPYNPAQTTSLIEDVFTNVTAQAIRGVDLSAKTGLSLPRGRLDAFANATWLQITQQTLASTPAVELTGTLFNPPSWRLRSGLTWTYAGFSASGILNYVASETDTNRAPTAVVGSWTTIDLNLAYRRPIGPGPLSGLETSLAITNLFDRAPPVAKGAALQAQGIAFDSTNTSDIGRFIALTVRKRF
jgi:outer membrane receptor protein involved in Fe transport